MRILNTFVAALFAIFLSTFAVLADVGPVEGRHGPGTRQTTFEPVYGQARQMDVANRVTRLKAAGVHPPTAEQYAKAVKAIQEWCGANCQPSAAVHAWIAEGPPAPAARQRPAREPRTQAAPPPRAAVHAPASGRGGVTIICGSCTF
jgi:hypothetical protein